MKIILIVTLSFFGFNSFAQTAVISNKSHSGAMAEVLHQPDNFGGRFDEPPIIEINFRKVDTVRRYNDCIIQSGSTVLDTTRFNDTICHIESIRQEGYSLESIQKMYPAGVIFIGFEKAEEDNSNDSGSFWFNGSPFRSGASWLFAFIAVSYLLYLITPTFKKR